MRTFWTLMMISFLLLLVASSVKNALLGLGCVIAASITSFSALLVFLLITRDPATIAPPRRRRPF